MTILLFFIKKFIILTRKNCRLIGEYMINRKLISDFADIIGNLTIAVHLESLKDVKDDYEGVLDELIKWVKYYYENKNLDIVSYENSLRIHDLLDEIRNELIPNKSIGIESMLSDNILIRYEVIIKEINNERGKKWVKMNMDIMLMMKESK